MDKFSIVANRLRREGTRFRQNVPMDSFIVDFVVNKKYAVLITNDDILSKSEVLERKRLTPFKLRTNYMFEEDLMWLIELIKK